MDSSENDGAEVPLAGRARCLARCGPWLAAACLVAAAACGGGERVQPDAGPDGDGDGDGDSDLEVVVEPPAPPALPVLTPCPPGWREIPPEDEDGVATCDPWPEGGPQDCADDEAHFPGEPGCARIGTACPAGDYTPPLDPAAPALYVKAGAPAGGEGTEASPFGTIAEAMASADPGTIIVLSRGTFDEAVTLRRGVTLWGACVAETLLTCSERSDMAGTVTPTGADTAVENLTLSGLRPGVLLISPTASITVDSVVVRDAEVAGIGVVQGSATITSTAIRETRSRGTDHAYGHGLEANAGATVVVERAAIERNRDMGVAVTEPGTSVILTDVAVRDTRSADLRGTGGQGIGVLLGDLVVVRGAIQGNRNAGVQVQSAGSAAHLTDVVVSDTLEAEATGFYGSGLSVGLGANDVEVERGLFERNRGYGVVAVYVGTAVRLSDVVIRDTMSQTADQTIGVGLAVEDRADAVVDRALVVRNRVVGVHVGYGATATFSDLVVRDTEAQESDSTFGVGLEAFRSGELHVSRAGFERNRDVGVSVLDCDAPVVFEDTVVRDTRGQASDGLYGYGIGVGSSSSFTLSRGLIERCMDVGLFVSESATTVSDLVVREIAAAADEGGGIGVASICGADLRVSTFRVLDNALVGFMLGEGWHFDESGFPAFCEAGGSADLHVGEIGASPIGLSVQVGGFDRDMLDRVVFRDCESEIDTAEVPVPEPSLPWEGWSD